MSKLLNILVGLSQILVGMGILVFWIFFFLVIVKKDANKTENFFSHEKSFPIADLGWIVPNLFIASIGLFTSQSFGIFFTIISGSSLIFLGLLDTTYNAQNKLYANSVSDAILYLFNNISCLAFGTIYIVYGLFNF